MLTILPYSGLAAHCEDTKELAVQYYTPASVSTRSMQIRIYFHFIDEFSGLLFPVPCPAHQIALYITWLSKFFKYNSLTN